MSIRSCLRRARPSALLASAAGLVAAGGLVVGVAAPATAAVPALGPGGAIVSLAHANLGDPYRWGGTTPAGFDCSGFTQYLYRSVGVALPHNANAQFHSVARVSAAAAQPGDLVFFLAGDHAYHAGVYAGNHVVIDEPGGGRGVSERPIWTSAVAYGRAA